MLTNKQTKKKKNNSGGGFGKGFKYLSAKSHLNSQLCFYQIVEDPKKALISNEKFLQDCRAAAMQIARRALFWAAQHLNSAQAHLKSSRSAR